MTVTYHRATLLLLVLVLILALPAFIDGGKAYSAVFSISWQWVAIFVLLTFLRWYCEACRFQIPLLANGCQLGRWQILSIILAENFAAVATPVGMGGVATFLLLFRKKRVPMPVAAASGLFILFMDVISVFFFLTLALILSFSSLNSGLSRSELITLILGFVLLIGIFIAIHQRNRLARLVIQCRPQRLLPSHHREKTAKWLDSMESALERTSQITPGKLITVVGYSLIIWAIRFTLLFLAMMALGHAAYWPHIALVHFVSTLAGMLTFLPSGFPGTDLSIAAFLSSSLSRTDILSVLLLWRLVSYYTTFTVGSLSFLVLSIQRE